MILSYSRNFIFVHVHKTGGDSVTASLAPLLGRPDLVIRADWPLWFQKLLTGGSGNELAQLRKHSPARAIERVVQPEVWDRSFKFAFVRHPIGRTVSLYRYALSKLEERRRFDVRHGIYLAPPVRSNDPLRWRSVRALLDTGSFSNFIRHPLLERDLSMIPQLYSLTDGDGRMLVNFVGRFESFQEDFDSIQGSLGLPARALPWRNRTALRDLPGVEVCDEDRAFLSERFRADFAYFTYDPLVDS